MAREAKCKHCGGDIHEVEVWQHNDPEDADAHGRTTSRAGRAVVS